MKNLIYISLLASGIAFGQNAMEKGDDLYAKYDFDNAIESYNKAISSNKATEDVNLKIANSYFNLTNYKQALPWYQRAISADYSNVDEGDFLKYIQCLKSEGQYEDADAILMEYYAGNSEKLAQLKKQKAAFDIKRDNLYVLRNLPINSANSDFGVANYGNKILFASSRAGEGELTKKTYAWNEQPYLNIYEAQRNTANGNLTNDKLFEGLNSQYHDAMICFNKENTRVYFSTNQLRKKGKLKTNEDGTSTLQIMLADVVEGKIANIVSLSINSEEYSCSHPMLSEDGKFLYFVSNMENGMGETDIYRAPVKADGTVGSPKNLGPKINTPGREMFPTLQEGKLYFSSDGHYGIGGLDLFASKIKGDNFENPENLGRPFNSEMDDFNIYWTKAGVNGYLSSNRLGGKGDDDIYFFTKDDQNWYQDVFGNVKEQTTKEIIPFATVKVYDDLDSLIAETQADSLGRFEVQLPCSSTNRLVFSKENHSTEELDVTTPDTPKVPEEEDAEDVYLTLYKTLVKEEDGVEKIIVNPIYFDYDKAEITPQAEVELNRVIDAMNKFPSIVIKIESHTDARGKDSYNLKLSDDRAKSTRDYLIEQGIDPNRIISAVGYGEQQIKNKCKNGVECTDDEHFVNRRSDFIVVKK